jgi:tetratricopeptide (TPR) repeat protein
MLSRRAAFILSLVIVCICYLNSLPNDFVFDDAAIVGSNPAIRSVSPIHFLKSSYWTQQQSEGIYRPLTIFSLSLDYALWHRWAPGFRLTNLTLHAINGFLVFLLCSSLLGEGIVPVAAMLIYIVHPAHTEAVTSIVGRSELFSACFFMGAWLLFRNGRTIWSAVLFFLALLSKENAIVLPAILLLDTVGTIYRSVNESAPEARKSVAPAEGRGVDSEVSRAPYRLGCLLFVALAYLVLRFSVLGSIGIPVSAQYMSGRLTYFERLMTSGRVFIHYLILIFFPVNLAGDYDFNAIPIARFSSLDAWLGLVLILAIVLGAVWYRSRNWALTFSILFAFVVFMPSSNWILPISVLMAERFLYLPLVGVSIALAIAFSALKDPRHRKLIAAGGLAVAIVLCNSHDYIRRNDFTFFANMVRVVPNSAKARLGYGYALLQVGRNDEAASQLEAGLRIIPDYPELLTTLAMTKVHANNCTQAWPLLNRAIQLDPEHPDTHRRMGDCYFKEGKLQEAEAMYRRALERMPYPDAMLYFMWGRSLEDTGQTKSAVAAFERAALIEPDNAFIKSKLDSLRSQ